MAAEKTDASDDAAVANPSADTAAPTNDADKENDDQRAPVPDSCSTVGKEGVGAGHDCIFPFKYKGKSYSTCTKTGHKKNWCYVKVDNKGVGIEGQWADCGSSCPMAAEKTDASDDAAVANPGADTAAPSNDVNEEDDACSTVGKEGVG